jgi:hypothetical protein
MDTSKAGAFLIKKGYNLESYFSITSVSELMTEFSAENIIPDDFDQVLSEAERVGWVFYQGKWVKDGWSDKTSKELYKLIKGDKYFESRLKK